MKLVAARQWWRHRWLFINFTTSLTFVSFLLQADFDAKLESAGDLLVLVDFHATWCGPCKMIAPKLEEFANTYSNKLVIVKVNHAFFIATCYVIVSNNFRSTLTSAKTLRWSTIFPRCRPSFSSRRVSRLTASAEPMQRSWRSTSFNTRRFTFQYFF